MKQQKTLVWLLLAVMLLALAGCSAGTSEGTKNITVNIIYADQTTDEIAITTQAQYLAEALAEKELIEYREDGYYTTVNGVTADYSADKSWWMLTKSGVMTTEGFNTQPIADGDSFEITYTID